jgi:ornithine carbamoyltransferase
MGIYKVNINTLKIKEFIGGGKEEVPVTYSIIKTKDILVHRSVDGNYKSTSKEIDTYRQASNFIEEISSNILHNKGDQEYLKNKDLLIRDLYRDYVDDSNLIKATPKEKKQFKDEEKLLKLVKKQAKKIHK